MVFLILKHHGFSSAHDGVADKQIKSGVLGTFNSCFKNESSMEASFLSAEQFNLFLFDVLKAVFLVKDEFSVILYS